MIDVAIKKKMSQFVANTETLVTLIRYMCRIQNAKFITMTKQHSRNAGFSIRLGFDNDILVCSDPERINRQRIDIQFPY